MTYVIETSDLGVQLAQSTILHPISIAVKKGENVGIIGSNGAGKSTLFNHLTDADVYQADQLFATLDPTLRRLSLNKQQHVILADTVGFIQNLPHDLVDAFHATLQETCEADLLLHVVDASDEQKNEHIEQVNQVLKHIGAEHCPQLLVYNKIDQTQQLPHVDIGADNDIKRVWISALHDQGLNLLNSALSQYFDQQHQQVSLKLPLEQPELRSLLYKHNAIISEAYDPDGHWVVAARLNNQLYERFSAYIKSSPDYFS